jgi:tetratricopeptide (TPR) repeat protein
MSIGLLSVLLSCVTLTARGASPAAFDGGCIPAGGVAPPSNTPGILSRRALPSGRLPRLGATLDFHHGLLTAAGRQGVEDPELQAAVQQFFTTQEAEDVEGYLALWSKSVQRPTAAQLKFVFESGDDRFSAISILKISPIDDRVRVRVSAMRERSMPPRAVGGPPRVFQSTSEWSLLYVREGNAWKLLREAPAAEGLAESLLDAKAGEPREEFLAADPDLVNDALILAISRRASTAAQVGNYPAAQTAFALMRDIARRVGNQRFEGEALQNLANAMYFQRNLPGALQAYEERLALERGRADREGIASALLGVATIRYSFAEYGAALASYREALAIQETLGDEGAIATTLISTGNVLYLQGDFPGAIAEYTRSREINRKTGNTTGEADALEGLGRVFLAQGDYLSALEAFGGVLADAKATGNRNDQATALLSLGDAHFRLGNLERARLAQDEARVHFEGIKSVADAGRAWQALALTDLAAARFGLAEEEYRKSSASCHAAADKECAASAVVGLAFAQTAQEKFQEGIASYKQAIEAFTALARREQAARSEVGLSQALARSGEHRTALEAAVRARSHGEALTNDDVLWRALVAEARALRRLRERTIAVAAAEAAVAAVERLLETARVRPSSPVARDSSAAFAMLALLQAEAGDGAAAFESVERMRAHDLRVILAPVERDISRGMTDAERTEERAAAVDLVSLHAQLSREKALPKPDADRIGRLEKMIAGAAERRAAQQQRIFERLPELRTWRGLTPAATRTDVAALLPDTSTLLLELVVGDDELLIVAARRAGKGIAFRTHFEAASRRVLAERVGKLMQESTLRDPTAWRLAALELIPGLSAVFGSASRAIVIPHEVLWRVPFEALPGERGYLADSVTVTYAPSVTALVRPPKRAAVVEGQPAADLLVIASAPQLAPAAIESVAHTAPGWVLRSPGRATEEIKAIAGASADPAGTVIIEGAGATEAAVRDRLPGARVIHVGAPFRINGASPLFSPFLLAPDQAHDGALEAREIMNLDLRAQAAIVSDGAAMAMREAADEVAPVAWAWRAAGVPALVLPRWPTDDTLSDQMLADLHARLRAGDSPEAALQAARATLRASNPAPYYWAGWMLVAF